MKAMNRTIFEWLNNKKKHGCKIVMLSVKQVNWTRILCSIYFIKDGGIGQTILCLRSAQSSWLYCFGSRKVVEIWEWVVWVTCRNHTVWNIHWLVLYSEDLTLTYRHFWKKVNNWLTISCLSEFKSRAPWLGNFKKTPVAFH